MSYEGPLTGRTALVTGASSGIGASTVRRLLEAGARVHGIARRREALEEVAPEALAAGQFHAHAIDLRDSETIAELAGDLAANDPVDILVCVAGTNVPNRRFSQLTETSFDDVIQTNLYGVFRVMQLTIDQIRERKGDIVIVSSIAATWPDHSGAAYGASKSALLGLARGASRDEHMNGVRVCSILPSFVNTPILDRRPVPPPAEIREWAIAPEDVADTIVFAVSLPPRVNIAEVSIVATRLQSLGNTQQASPALPSPTSPS